MSQSVELLVEGCLAEGVDFFEALERARQSLEPADYTFACLKLETRMAQQPSVFDITSRIDILTEASNSVPADRRDLIIKISERFAAIGRPHLALVALVSDALRPESGLTFAARNQIQALLAAASPNIVEHGHKLIVDELSATHVIDPARKRQLIEIGTTRERVPGQGSTMILAHLCHALGMDFVTVDMDPHNSSVAQRMMNDAGLSYKAITAKGEDYLADHPGPIDHVFLDAYDFDHGKHSGLRQERYEMMLGGPINDAACHEMHLACVKSLVEKQAADGLICFDDTWQDDNGLWTAKGKLAMPYLLDNGYVVIATHGTAALLRRGDAA